MEISEEELEKIVEKIVEKKVREKEEQNEHRIVELYQLAMKHREFLLRLSLLDDDERVKISVAMEYLKMSKICPNSRCYKMCQVFMSIFDDKEKLIEIKMKRLNSLQNVVKENDIDKKIYLLHYQYLSSKIQDLRKTKQEHSEEKLDQAIQERTDLKQNIKENDEYKKILLEKYKEKLDKWR